MATNESAEDPLSELNLGIRELFRVLVPGAYALAIFEWLASGKPDQAMIEGRALPSIAISIVAGLAAYGLQVHEKWWPYCSVFELYREKLNQAVADVAQVDSSRNYVSEYKYFLETYAPHFKERIHYFSSFYYMLAEMSLISAIAALALLYNFFKGLNPDRPFSTYSILVALALQILKLYRDPSEPSANGINAEHRLYNGWYRYAFTWLGVATIWVVWNYALCLWLHRIWPLGQIFGVDWRFWVLVSAAFIFERLGAKQWKSVINEQVVLVNEKAVGLKKVIGAYHSVTHSDRSA